ncbi:hypothetical protein HGRIS_013535 [Hohenbuehelia grisea]|uniref:F-box domain-containing protein n=1 Tax=Hohenbuehelia grisea TaxID=104357 RepID=A0ABR3IVV4_9AGAR
MNIKPPAVSEASFHVNGELADLEARSPILDNSLAATGGLVCGTRLQRGSVCHQVDVHDVHDRRSNPINNIPVEVMQEIFTRCLPSDRYIKPNAYDTPMALMQVSSAWRNVAISTSKLWSSLYIMVSNDNHVKSAQLMRVWLERSKQRPISLFLCASNASLANLSEVYAMVVSNIHRMKHLRLSLPFFDRTPLIKLLNSGAPFLEELEVRLSRNVRQRRNHFHPAGERIPEFTLTASSAPRLRSLIWQNNTQSFLTPCRFDFSTITELTMHDTLSSEQCVAILKGCPALRTCRLSCYSMPGDLLPTEQPIVHSALKHLSITMSTEGGPLFNRLTLPALEILRLTDVISAIDDEFDFQLWNQATFIDFLRCSRCALTELQLSNVLSSEDELIEVLDLISPSLEVLHLADVRGITSIMDRALELLTVRQAPDGSVTCLCPRLDTIRFGPCLASTDGMLADMVESRWKASEATRGSGSLAIARPRYINPRLDVDHIQDMRRLSALREEGLDMPLY